MGLLRVSGIVLDYSEEYRTHLGGRSGGQLRVWDVRHIVGWAVTGRRRHLWGPRAICCIATVRVILSTVAVVKQG